MIEHDETALYIDIGTNAELAITTSTGISVASAAAGPALEAGGVVSGGPASEGGIRSVSWSEESALVCEVIGGGDGGWLTGSGILTAVASLLQSGHLSADGLLSREGPLLDRFVEVGGVLAVRIAGTAETPVLLSQTDIREVQSAKAAIAAGVRCLAQASGVKPKAIQKAVVAGALGAAVSAEDLVAIGLLPTELATRTVQAGNTSLLGAAMIAADPPLLDRALEAMADVAHVELASSETFSEEFLAALSLCPYTLKKGFPNS
jgi:uncharacterized 2Fe-2S/4Fe-4S cluster protein (DUF4445 family)